MQSVHKNNSPEKKAVQTAPAAEVDKRKVAEEQARQKLKRLSRETVDCSSYDF
ncbi:hypothetical protein [Marinobacterium arenosum]|uniref:hypothetical protein n=1 Tax=Marinobacterium arenosum TaxID=2862496 RepID=UPI001C93FB0D|nr:hypothetical protein [Marinobacterium arenosum]MBY4676731.1 hypothetical protein [Marinobacterium arenosum]